MKIVQQNIVKKIILGVVGIGILYLGYNYAQYKSFTTNTKNTLNTTQNVQEAYFSSGCFWCTESAFEKYKKNGIIDVISGYAGGKIQNPTYEQVSKGITQYRESVKVLYDADKIDYNDLLEIYWRTANPTDNGGQYVDRGFQYTTAIFYKNDKEKKQAKSSLRALEATGMYGDKKLITPIIPFTTFYAAEEYHQDYYKKNPLRYNAYTNGSGRKEYLEDIWGDNLKYNFGEKSLKTQKIMKNYKGENLTDLQFRVTMEKGTERPFNNTYWDNKKQGIYVDIIDGSPLYSSLDKYVSGTGGPSFTKPIDKMNIEEKEDNSLFSQRTEIVGRKSQAHIGHVFNDGPKDKGGLRYCMNSAAMDFIPKEQLKERGYGKYLKLFEK